MARFCLATIRVKQKTNRIRGRELLSVNFTTTNLKRRCRFLKIGVFKSINFLLWLFGYIHLIQNSDINTVQHNTQSANPTKYIAWTTVK